MRRAVTICSNVMATLSLLLCLSTTLLSVRSYWVADTYAFWNFPGFLLTSSRGTLMALGRPSPVPQDFLARLKSDPRAHGYQRSAPYTIGRRPNDIGIAGVYWFYTHGGKFPGGNMMPMWTLTIPHWMIVILFGLFPFSRVWRWTRYQRQSAENRCPSCGYDLRATPERCPECGRTVISIAGPARLDAQW